MSLFTLITPQTGITSVYESISDGLWNKEEFKSIFTLHERLLMGVGIMAIKIDSNYYLYLSSGWLTIDELNKIYNYTTNVVKKGAYNDVKNIYIKCSNLGKLTEDISWIMTNIIKRKNTTISIQGDVGSFYQNYIDDPKNYESNPW